MSESSVILSKIRDGNQILRLNFLRLSALTCLAYAGCKYNDPKPVPQDQFNCGSLSPCYYSLYAQKERRGLLNIIGYSCSDTIPTDSANEIKLYPLCDLYIKRKSIYYLRPTDISGEFSEDFDAQFYWDFPKVKHWEFPAGSPLRFQEMNGGWVLRLFIQSRLTSQDERTPFTIITIRARNKVMEYRITKLNTGSWQPNVGMTPDTVIFEDSGVAQSDINRSYAKISNLPEFEFSRLSPVTGCDGRFFGNGVRIELITDSSWFMSKGLVRSIGDYWPSFKNLIQQNFANSAITNDSELWDPPVIPMTMYGKVDSSVFYNRRAMGIDEKTKTFFWRPPHPDDMCEAIFWGDYCGETWFPK